MAEYEGTPESVMALSDDELEQVLAGLEDQMRRMNLARDALDEFCPVGAGMLYKLTDQLLLHCTEATQREMRRYRAGTPVATRTARQVSDGHGGVRDNGRPGERAGHSGAKVVADDSRQPGRAVVSTAVLSSNNTAVDKTEKTAGLPRNHEFTFECATPAKLAKNGSRVPLPPPPATPPVRHPAERLHPVAGAGQAQREKAQAARQCVKGGQTPGAPTSHPPATPEALSGSAVTGSALTVSSTSPHPPFASTYIGRVPPSHSDHRRRNVPSPAPDVGRNSTPLGYRLASVSSSNLYISHRSL